MHVAVLTITLYAPFAHSLKDKRSEIKSLMAKLRAKFNASVAETNAQDSHQTLVITIAALASDTAQADSTMDHVLNFIEANTQAQIQNVLRELR